MDLLYKMKFKGFISKYEDIELQDIKSFIIKKYNINSLIEYKLFFYIYLRYIGILIHELGKKDIKSNPLIISKFYRKIKIKYFLKEFILDEKNKTLEYIFKLISDLILINKINFIDEIKTKSLNLIINNKEGKQIFKLNIPIKLNEDKVNSNSLIYNLNPCLKNIKIILILKTFQGII